MGFTLTSALPASIDHLTVAPHARVCTGLRPAYQAEMKAGGLAFTAV